MKVLVQSIAVFDRRNKHVADMKNDSQLHHIARKIRYLHIKDEPECFGDRHLLQAAEGFFFSPACIKGVSPEKMK